MSLSARQAAAEARLQAASDKRAAKQAQLVNRLRAPKRIKPAANMSALRERWYRRPWVQMCEVCGEEPAVHAHHILREQTLRRFASTYGFDFQVTRFDIRNRLWIGERCHSRHHTATERIPLSALPEAAWEFAREMGLDWSLEAEYGVEEAA